MQTTATIRVMIVNDSPYMSRLLSDIITSNKEIEVVTKATDGKDALDKIPNYKPDVIILDLEMPNMDGLTFIEKVSQNEKLIPIIVVSNYGKENSKLILDSLEFGAVDFLPLIQADPSKVSSFRDKLITKIKTAAKTDPYELITRNICSLRPAEKKSIDLSDSASEIVIIGASTGGPEVVSQIIELLPGDLKAGVLVVQHMPKDYLVSFTQRLGKYSSLKVKLAETGDLIKDGQVLVAPGDFHMLVSENHRIILDQSPKRFGVRPAVNMTMITASEVYGSDSIGVILTGMGHDGGFGMRAIKKRGGYTIVQNEQSCEAYGMPKAVVCLNVADTILSPEKIPEEIVLGVKDHRR